MNPHKFSVTYWRDNDRWTAECEHCPANLEWPVAIYRETLADALLEHTLSCRSRVAS